MRGPEERVSGGRVPGHDMGLLRCLGDGRHAFLRLLLLLQQPARPNM